ncbi:MAG: aminopeptidase P family protein [Anaerolineales bacterium]
MNIYTQRLARFAKLLSDTGLDAAVINPSPTLTYLTGLHFHLMERPVVLVVSPDKEPGLILPALEMAKVAGLSYQVHAFPYGENPETWAQVFRSALHSLDLFGRTIGVEPRALRVLELRLLEYGAPGAHIVSAETALADLRIRKDANELAKMRQAVKIAQDALEATLPLIKIGMSEQELANELVIQLLRHGSQPEMPFSPIVCAGPNSANPHASPGERKIQAGDLLLFDWGAAYEGYISDLTRTFAVGEIDPKLEQIHKIVQEANAAGRAAGKGGLPCAVVDQAAREVIESAGYGIYFTHRTGHGIGMEGHEEPYMRGDNMKLLEPGMCYTVEPGIYLPGEGGVRIEDNLVITESGAESLSDLPRELRVVG